jgi:hypothetical protein
MTWRDVTTEKLADVKFNVPIAAEEFAKPAGAGSPLGDLGNPNPTSS